jgi:hypothetical protein
MAFSPSRLLTLAAVVLFVLAAVGVTFGSFGELDIDSLGLACLAAAQLI